MTSKSKESKDLAVPEPTPLAIFSVDPGQVTAAITANLGAGKALNVSLLDQIRVPSGGGKAWDLPALEGSTAATTFTAIIADKHDARAYWDHPVGTDSTPPDCYSNDGFTGVGIPGGDCTICPYAQWGSKAESRAQACKQTLMLYLIRPDDLLPTVFRVPPSSLTAMQKYFLRLASKGIYYYSVQTTFTLTVVKNAAGIAYSQVVPNVGGILSREEAGRIAAYAEELRPFLRAAQAQQAMMDPTTDPSMIEEIIL